MSSLDDHFPDPKFSEQMVATRLGVVRTNQLFNDSKFRTPKNVSPLIISSRFFVSSSSHHPYWLHLIILCPCVSRYFISHISVSQNQAVSPQKKELLSVFLSVDCFCGEF